MRLSVNLFYNSQDVNVIKRINHPIRQNYNHGLYFFRIYTRSLDSLKIPLLPENWMEFFVRNNLKIRYIQGIRSFSKFYFPFITTFGD